MTSRIFPKEKEVRQVNIEGQRTKRQAAEGLPHANRNPPPPPTVKEKQQTISRERANRALVSGTKKEPKPKLLGPDILRWGGGLPREGVGVEKFGMSLETRETKLFWRDIPGFCRVRDIPEVPEKFEKKKCVFNFRPLYLSCFSRGPFWTLKIGLN